MKCLSKGKKQFRFETNFFSRFFAEGDSLRPLYVVFLTIFSCFYRVKKTIKNFFFPFFFFLLFLFFLPTWTKFKTVLIILSSSNKLLLLFERNLGKQKLLVRRREEKKRERKKKREREKGCKKKRKKKKKRRRLKIESKIQKQKQKNSLTFFLFLSLFSVVLGSGLGNFVSQVEDAITLSYKDVPGMPLPTVQGHAGKFVAGKIGKERVYFMAGRLHRYEGYPPSQITFSVRLFALLGVRTYVATNAAGFLDLFSFFFFFVFFFLFLFSFSFSF